MKILSRRQSNLVKESLIEDFNNAINKDYFKEQCEKKIMKAASELKNNYSIHSSFSEDLLEIYEEFKHNYLITSDLRQINAVTNNVFNQKIKWLANTNVLTTLFYDMLYGQDKGSSLIESSHEDIRNFLMNNFIDADGKELAFNTADTYIRLERVEKRAKRGNRSELGNVKLKNMR